MNFVEIFLIAVSMAMDAFAVCLSAGARPDTNGARPTFRLVFHFDLFQFLMPVVGWLGGTMISSVITPFDHWIAFGLLAFVGARMIHSGLNPDGETLKVDPSRGLTMAMLSIAVSIDAFAIGLTLAFLKTSIWYPALVIGVVTGLISWLGLRIGNHLGVLFGKRMEILGGVILVLIGLRILYSHLA